MEYQREQQVAIAAVTAAAQLCQRVRDSRELMTLSKQDSSPVTIADFGAQAVICRTIAHAFPADSIVAEENASLLHQPDMGQQLHQVTSYVKALMPDATAQAVLEWIDQGKATVGQRFWALDPIDGTKGFLRGDQYAIALALIEAGVVQLGVLACPAFSVNSDSDLAFADSGVLFAAVRAQGTRMISLHNQYSQMIKIDAIRPTNTWRLAESVESGHGNPSLQRAVAQAIGLRTVPLQMDSQAKYGAIACGQAAVYMRLPWTEVPGYQENIWDHAAGAIVVEEAGGKVTDMDGKRLDFTQGTKLVNNRGIVASNGFLHEAVVAALARPSIKTESV